MFRISPMEIITQVYKDKWKKMFIAAVFYKNRQEPECQSIGQLLK